MRLDNDGQFWNIAKNAGTGVYATQKRGRWQYRTASGNLLASGMAPAAFVKSFWYRNDFQD